MQYDLNGEGTLCALLVDRRELLAQCRQREFRELQCRWQQACRLCRLKVQQGYVRAHFVTGRHGVPLTECQPSPMLR